MRIALPFPRKHTPDAPPQTRRKRPGAGRIGLALASLVVLLAIGLAIWRTRFAASPNPTIAVPIIIGDLTVQVESSGSVRPARAVDLPFQATGQIEQVLVRPGDLVRAGQPLARLNDHDLQLQLQQAQADLKTAQAQLNKANNGAATALDLAEADSKLQAAQAQMQKTRAGSGSAADLRQAQANLQAAQARLDALKNPTPSKLSAAQLDLSQARTALSTSRDSLSAAKNSAEQDMNRATQSLNQAQASYSTALQNWQSVQDTGRDPYSPTTTDSTGKATPKKLNAAERQKYYEAFLQAEAALHSAESALTQAQLNFDSARQKEAAEIPQAEATVENAQQQLDALLHPDHASLTAAQADVVSAQAEVDKLRQGGTSADISAAQALVDQAKIARQRLSAPASAADIASAEADLTQAQTQLDLAKTKLAQATLIAPFDGTVATVDITPGGMAGSAAAMSLVDLAALHVDVNISETELAQIKLGQPASITFDALPNLTLSGVVDSIAPTSTSGQNIVTYLVQVRFDPGKAQVKVGMSADLSIEVERHVGVLQVPSRAISAIGPIKTVQLLQGEAQTPVTIPVEIGASNGAMTEIVKCVDTGTQCLHANDQLAISLPSGDSQGGPGGSQPGQFFSTSAEPASSGPIRQVIVTGK